MATEAEVQASAFNLLAQLRSIHQDLLALNDAMMQSPDVAQAIGRDVIAAQNQYNDLQVRFVQVYVLVTGGPAPDGLSALPIAAIAYAAGALAAIAAAVYLLKPVVDAIKLNAQAAVNKSQGQLAVAAGANDLLRQADANDAAGNTALAAQQRKQAQDMLNSAGPSSGFSQWVQDNWFTLAVVGTAAFTIPRLVGD